MLPHEHAWYTFLKKQRGDHQARPNRCAWVIDATMPLVCSKILKKGSIELYCPKHSRTWKSLMIRDGSAGPTRRVK